ncbi:MAG: VanZ family protein [Clostridiales Family XIII bacterium]|jgi:glycopeptide antibiotics resistance protein|nr:VanZ family protein [Clostridiales Family XIII bacterium]
MKNNKQYIFTIALCIIYLLLLAGVILFKLPFFNDFSDRVRVVNLIPFQGSYDESGGIVLREIVENIFIFVPFGVYVSMLRRGWTFAKRALLAAGLSLLFEILQFIFVLGVSDITDILSNTLGGLAGIGAYSLASRMLKARTIKIINIAALAITVCVVLRFAQLFYMSHFMMRPPQ